jgi:hypothetical protein
MLGEFIPRSEAFRHNLSAKQTDVAPDRILTSKSGNLVSLLKTKFSGDIRRRYIMNCK